MVSTSAVNFNLGPYIVSFDAGIVDDYEICELEPVNNETKYKINRGIIPVKFTIYKAIVTNKAKNDGIFVQLWQYDQLMGVDDKRKLYEDSILYNPLQGFWQNSSHPHLIDGMEGLVALLKPPSKKDISIGKYCRAKLRDDYVYIGSYWPDESKLGPKLRSFSVWCSLISTYPWEEGAKNIFDSLKVRNVI